MKKNPNRSFIQALTCDPLSKKLRSCKKIIYLCFSPLFRFSTFASFHNIASLCWCESFVPKGILRNPQWSSPSLFLLLFVGQNPSFFWSKFISESVCYMGNIVISHTRILSPSVFSRFLNHPSVCIDYIVMPHQYHWCTPKQECAWI